MRRESGTRRCGRDEGMPSSGGEEGLPTLPEERVSVLRARRGSIQVKVDGLLAQMERLDLLIREADRELARRSQDGDEVKTRVGRRPVKVVGRGVARSAMPPTVPSRPVVPVEQSVTDDGIICLIDGVRRRMLAPYLRTRYGMTPAMYRERFGLPYDYPMSVIGRGKPGRVGATHRGRAMSKAIKDVLEGIDRSRAISSVLGRSRTPLTTREVTERILADHGRNVRDSVLLMEVASRIGTQLHQMFEIGEVERSGDSYRRQWSLPRRRAVRRG